MSVDTLRHVQLTDGQPDTVDGSGLVSVRARKWRWTNVPPINSGWYAMRWNEDRRNKVMFYFSAEQIGKLHSNPFAWLDGVEFSDRPVQWPLEPNVEDSNPTMVWQREAYNESDDLPEPQNWSSGLIFLLGMIMGLGLTLFGVFLAMYH